MVPVWLIVTLATLTAFLWLRRLLARRGRTQNRILIDGSNVMHWNGGTADLFVVRRVTEALSTHGYDVGIIFDANAGYKLADHYMNDTALAKALGLKEKQVMVAPKGNPADGFLLQAAREMDAPIVTNDRFRDWQAEFPEIAAPGRLIHGSFRDGTPCLRPSKGKPA